MNIIAPITSYTGYGITSYNILRSLYKIDSNIKLFPIGSVNIEQGWDQEIIKNSINNQENFDKEECCFKIWHDNDLITRTAGNSKYATLSFFEIDKISKKSKIGYELSDIIFAPSEWAKNILMSNGISKDIIVCPQGVNRDVFNDQEPADKDKEKYIFINIGKWEIRKGHDILVDIFNNAFNEDDNVELWMLNHNSFLNTEQTNEWVSLYQNSKLANKIRIFPRLPTQHHIAKIISYADCGIYPSRAEGWNNEAIETLSMNKPLIITNYSAHTEYCNNKNSYLVDIKNTTPANDDIWFHGEGNWADIDSDNIDQFIEHMRYVYKNNIRTNTEGVNTAKKYTWDNTANIINEKFLKS